MAEETNAGVKSLSQKSHIIRSVRGLVSVGIATLLSACPIVCCCIQQFIFHCLQVLVQGNASCAVSCKVSPRHGIGVDSHHVSCIHPCVSGGGDRCSYPVQITVEYAFLDATILHTMDITQRLPSALSGHMVHTGTASPRQGIRVGFFVLPGDAQYTAGASHVVVVEILSCVAYICSLCLAAIQQCAGNTGTVDGHLLSSPTAWGLPVLEW